MSGIINPSSTQNLTDYQDRAAEINRAITPSREPYGGELIDADDAEGSDDSSGDSDGGKDDSSGDDKGDDNGKDGDDDSAARLVGVPATVLLAAVGVAVAMA